MPSLILIAAMSRNRVIGRNNQLPWHLPADLAHFKALTLNHSVIMGRKTFEAIGKPLPNRHNIVVTHDPSRLDISSFLLKNTTRLSVVASITDALQIPAETLFIIGGATIYEQTLPLATQLNLTVIDHDFEGDTYFPEIDPRDWRLDSEEPHPKDQENPYNFRYLCYKRIYA